MDVIFAKIILKEEEKSITRRDLINDGFDCEIFVNEIRFKDTMKLKKENHIVYIFKQSYSNIQSMFEGCSLLTYINLSNYNTSNVTDMNHIFSDCSSLSSINLSNFDTKNVTNMDSMFFNCSLLTSINLSNFSNDNVTNMNSMFFNCSLLAVLLWHRLIYLILILIK